MHKLLVVLALCVHAAAARSQTASSKQRSILDAKGDTVVVLVIDKRSTAPMARVAVELWVPYYGECSRAPCLERIGWQGSTNTTGKIRIPRQVLQSATIVKTAGLYGNLTKAAYDDAKREWVLQMDGLEW